MTEPVQQALAAAAVLGALLYLVLRMRKKTGCGGGCGPSCSAKDLKKPTPDEAGNDE